MNPTPAAPVQPLRACMHAALQLGQRRAELDGARQRLSVRCAWVPREKMAWDGARAGRGRKNIPVPTPGESWARQDPL